MQRHSIGTARTLLLTAVLALSAAFVSPAALAADGELFAPPAMTQAAWNELAAAAQTEGSVPLIVMLDVPAWPEHALRLDDQIHQRAQIARARAAVLSALPAERRGRVRSDDAMPLLSLVADARDLERLRRSKHVVSVTRDREITLDGASGSAAGTSANGSAIQLSEWWDWYRIGIDKTRGWGHIGSGQLIAVLDSGVDRNHGWLSGKVVNEACFAQSAPGSPYGGCPQGMASKLGYGAAAPCDYHALCGHGTHVAHTAAGTWGVASGAQLMAIQIFHRGANGAPTYWESDVIWGLKHVYEQRGYYRIAAVNMSIGGTAPGGYLYGGYCDNGPGSDTTTTATYLAGWINALKSVGIATIVSSGNDNSSTGTRRPSCIANAISVGNTTLDPAGYDAVYGYVSGGSNSNATVDLLAPGTDICSAVPVTLDFDGNADGIGCGWIGTSMAAPHVAGAFAVARAFRSLTASAATVDYIDAALRRSGISVTDSRNGITRTRINVANLLYGI